MVLDRELAWSDTRWLKRLLKFPKLKNPQACIDDIEYRHRRGIDKSVVAALAGYDWNRNAPNLILKGGPQRANRGLRARSASRLAYMASP